MHLLAVLLAGSHKWVQALRDAGITEEDVLSERKISYSVCVACETEGQRVKNDGVLSEIAC